MFENADQIHDVFVGATGQKARDFGYLVSKPPSQLHEEFAEAYGLLTGLEIDVKTVQAVLSMHGYVQKAHSAMKDAQPKAPKMDVEAVVADLNASLKEAIAAGEAELAEAKDAPEVKKTRKPRIPSPKQVAETAADLATQAEPTQEAQAS